MFSMLDILKVAIKNLPDLMSRPDVWKTLYIDYHPPIVERAYLDVENTRINLHKIHPVDSGTALDASALYHPHPWPSAMMICRGSYESRLGYGDPNGPPPPQSGRLVLAPGTLYEMTDPREWHYVSPSDQPSYTVMVTGKPYEERKRGEAKKELRQLSSDEKAALFTFFRGFFGY